MAVADAGKQPQGREIRAMLAPGSPLREGIERVIAARRGTLIVVGTGAKVDEISSGGFVIDSPATSQRLSELAKMDGALVVNADATRVVRANVHLVPDPTIATTETGTRHRSAERAAKQSGRPVISVSESMGIVSLYYGGQKYVVESVSALLVRANQALRTLERYRSRFDEVSGLLSAREIEDAATVRDAVLALQRAEMMRRIAREVQDHVSDLGTEGRLIALQHDELFGPVAGDRDLLVRDYLADRRRRLATIVETIESLEIDDLLDNETVIKLLAYGTDALDRVVTPRGYRLLSRVPRLPVAVVDRLVDRFGTLPRLMEATLQELVAVEGVGELRARNIQDGLRRIAEAALLEHYV
jgi:diadenylate cyclase